MGRETLSLPPLMGFVAVCLCNFHGKVFSSALGCFGFTALSALLLAERLPYCTMSLDTSHFTMQPSVGSESNFWRASSEFV